VTGGERRDGAKPLVLALLKAFVGALVEAMKTATRRRANSSQFCIGHRGHELHPINGAFRDLLSWSRTRARVLAGAGTVSAESMQLSGSDRRALTRNAGDRAVVLEVVVDVDPRSGTEGNGLTGFVKVLPSNTCL
jgi:hypothetical protein